MINVAYIQNNPIFSKVDANLLAVLKIIPTNVSLDILVLPELFATGYLFANREELKLFAEEPGKGAITNFMMTLAKDLQCIIVGGFAEKSGNKIFNSAILITPFGSHYIYRKIHLFDREKELFDISNNSFSVINTNVAKIGMMICFDWYFPESARSLALQGAEIITHPSNLLLPHCPEAMKTRALENHVFTITANRTGIDKRTFGELSFIGKSCIYSPKGELLTSSSKQAIEMQFVSISPDEASKKQITLNNNLFEDRRPKYYTLN